MRHSVFFTLSLLFTLVPLGACAPPFGRELLDTVDPALSYRDILADPDRVRGARLLIGGTIVSVRNSREGGLIELLHRPLDRQARPRATDRSDGRFLAQTSEFVDPAVYSAGRDVSIVGEASGTTILRLDETDYTYPVLKIVSMHLWQPTGAPRFFFSIGVGHSH